MTDFFSSEQYNVQVSSDGSKITRHIQENGHPVIASAYFLNYALARLRAAHVLNNESMKSPEQKEATKKMLEELENKLKTFFDASYESEFQEAKKQRWAHRELSMSPRHLAAVEREYQQAFDKVYQHNIEKLKQVNVLLAYLVDPSQDARKVIKKINRRADLLRAQEPRPIQENHFEVLGLKVTSSHIPEGELTSAQKKLYQSIHGMPPPSTIYTSPSTIRDQFQVGQANAVRTEIKVGATTFTGHRHGSPSVLKIEDEAERQYRTLENVKQTMALAAREKLEKMDDEQRQKVLSGETPLSLEMATMSLLSPVADDESIKLDPMRQYRQVNDSRMAYWSLQGRDVFIELPPKVEGAKPEHIRVNLNSTFMNVGVNAARGIGTTTAKHLVQRVNNRGINHLTDNFLSSLHEIKDPSLAPIVNQIQQIERQQAILQAKAKIQQFDRSPLHKAYAQLESYNALLHPINIRLKEAKEELTACHTALHNKEHRAMVNVELLKEQEKALKSEIKRLKTTQSKIEPLRQKALKSIEKDEKKMDRLYKKLASARQKAYSKDKLKALQDKLDIIQIQKGETIKGDTNFRKLRLFVDTLDTFYNQPQPGLKRFIQVKLATRDKSKVLKKFHKSKDPKARDELIAKANAIQEKIDFLNKGNYRFQARFALLTQHMDQFVEWFCKSGEDRTGLLDEHIQGFCIFIEKYGYAPRWDNVEDNHKFHEIMPHVHNGVPTRETNGYNDDSPGLKVTDKDFEMKSVSYETDKKLANILKNSEKVKGHEKELLKRIQEKLAVSVSTVNKKATASKKSVGDLFTKLFTPSFTHAKSVKPIKPPSSPEVTPDPKRTSRPKH